jgi:2-amino-4-hydroxy-6-hydroxymethyldihydropteridine diphosphokinase
MSSKEELNLYIISLGSNTKDGDNNLSDAVDWLRSIIIVEAVSSIYSTPPLSGYGANYSNMVIFGRTERDIESLTQLLKKYECEAGRNDECRRLGIVPIDIDVVVCNNTIIRPRDYEANYFKIGFSEIVKNCGDS